MNALKNILLNLSLVPTTLARIVNPGEVLQDYLGLKSAEYDIRLKHGPRIRVRPGTTDKGIVKEVFLLDHYAKAVDHLPETGIVVDIGAQIGVFTSYVAHHRPSARIHSYEPMSDNFTLLEKNIEQNGFRNVVAHRAAVAATDGELKLYLSDDNTGMHSLHRPGKRFEMVTTHAFNSMFTELGLERCDVLKLDCEGSEYEIIESASDSTLRSIGTIMMEYHFPEKNPALIERLRRAGFTVHQSTHEALIFASRPLARARN